RDADREVIESLKRMTTEAEHVVNGIVVEASDACATCAGSFGRKVQPLPHEARFPEQMAIERRSELLQARVELGHHPQAEKTVRSDFLIAAHALGKAAAVARRQPKKRESVGDLLPGEITADRGPQRIHRARVAHQQVETGVEPLDAVHEQCEVNSRIPPECVPWWTVEGHDARDDGEEATSINRRLSVKRN